MIIIKLRDEPSTTVSPDQQQRYDAFTEVFKKLEDVTHAKFVSKANAIDNLFAMSQMSSMLQKLYGEIDAAVATPVMEDADHVLEYEDDDQDEVSIDPMKSTEPISEFQSF